MSRARPVLAGVGVNGLSCIITGRIFLLFDVTLSLDNWYKHISKQLSIECTAWVISSSS